MGLLRIAVWRWLPGGLLAGVTMMVGRRQRRLRLLRRQRRLPVRCRLLVVLLRVIVLVGRLLLLLLRMHRSGVGQLRPASRPLRVARVLVHACITVL